MLRGTLLLTILLLTTLTPLRAQVKLRTIVIDAGHGGHDVGAVGRISKEKEISLAVAIKVSKLLHQQMPGVKVVMTRTSDVYQHPVTKANIANNNKGELFISIHCNAAAPRVERKLTGYKTQLVYTGKGRNRKKVRKKVPVYKTIRTPNPARGTETYIWGAHKNDMKEKVMKENEALYLDSTLARQVKGFDPDSPEKMIMYSIKTKQYFTRSANLAMTIEEEFKKVGRNSREARQRQVGIWVLQATAMPSVLVETGYISNPEEEKYLNSKKGQQEIAQAIVNAIKRYENTLNHK